jgi:hypothetical protein
VGNRRLPGDLLTRRDKETRTWPSRDLVPLLITGGGVVLLCRYAGLTLWPAVLVLTGGSCLASSAPGPGISQVLSRVPGLFGWRA